MPETRPRPSTVPVDNIFSTPDEGRRRCKVAVHFCYRRRCPAVAARLPGRWRPRPERGVGAKPRTAGGGGCWSGGSRSSPAMVGSSPGYVACAAPAGRAAWSPARRRRHPRAVWCANTRRDRSGGGAGRSSTRQGSIRVTNGRSDGPQASGFWSGKRGCGADHRTGRRNRPTIGAGRGVGITSGGRGSGMTYDVT